MISGGLFVCTQRLKQLTDKAETTNTMLPAELREDDFISHPDAVFLAIRCARD